MIGINRHTGRAISGDAHLAQSIADILSTPKGTRVMRRDYGSDLPDLIDQPLNSLTIVDAYQAIASALGQWEPRISVERMEITRSEAGLADIELYFDSVVFDASQPAFIEVRL